MHALNHAHDHDHWGNCESCKHWHHEQQVAPKVEEVGECEQPEMTRFALQVSAHSGCDKHEPAAAVA